MTKRVLHLLWDGDLGGVQRYVMNILNNGEWKNVKHVVCCFNSSGRVLNSNTLRGIPVFELKIRHGWSLSAGKRLETLLAGDDYNVVHAHCDTPALLLNLKRLKDSRLIYTEHGDTLLRQKNTWLTGALWRYYNEYWDAMIMNSRLVETDFLKRFPCFKNKTVVCANPLLEVIDSGMRRPRKGSNYQIGFFGRLVRQKGVDRVLSVAEKLRERLPDAVVNIYGDGELKVSLEEECRRLGLEECVIFRGYTGKPLQMMSEMDCNIVPSRIEPFGLVALEALSVGTPVVGFNGTGVAEIVENNRNGILVDNGDIDGMAEAVTRILSDKTVWQEMSDSAIEHARNNFSLSRHCKRLEEIYLNND